MTQFVSLHNQTHFSILDALPSPKDLLLRAKDLDQPAIAITDHGSFAGAWDAYKAYKDTGVKLIIGCEMYFVPDLAHKNEEKFKHIVLIAKNATGYRNILSLNKKGFDNGVFFTKKVYPVIDWKMLESHADGVICLTACGNGIVSQLLMQKKFQEAEETLIKLHKLFKDDLAIEVQPNNLKRNANAYSEEIDQKFINHQLINLGKKLNIPIVPACNSHYLRKEDAETHDVLLAIGSHQPVYSNFRIKYPAPDFYLKSGDEVKAFFSRNYGEEFAEQICQNSVMFANKCENPDWIDPKYSNPSGKELPVFPVKDEPDYDKFVAWLTDQDETTKSLDEDKQYLRYKAEEAFCNLGLDKKGKEYRDRLEEEIDVLYHCGVSSYMLIVADYVKWARNNGVSVGPGRGCLTGDQLVLTNNGYRRLDTIKVGDKVYSHTGKLRSIVNTFKFDIEEELVSIKTFNGGAQKLVLTKDHKIFAKKFELCSEAKIYKYDDGNIGKYYPVKNPSNAEWIAAQDLNKKDYIFVPYLKRKSSKIKPFNISKYLSPKDILENDVILQPTHKTSIFSIRKIAKKLNISFEKIRKLKLGKDILSSQEKENLINYFNLNGMSLDEWINYKLNTFNKIKSTINVDNNFLYFVGRWIGDGSFHSKRGISICFNSKDIDGITKIKNYLQSIGFHVCQENRINNNTLLTVSNFSLFSLFKNIFPNYSSAKNKSLPSWFRKLNKEELHSLILGLHDADGSISGDMEFITTISEQLAFEVKESLWYLGIPSNIHFTPNPKRYDKITQPSYKITFTGFKKNKFAKNLNEEGYFARIDEIVKLPKSKTTVYDITVEKDHSYLTSSGIVHNSVGGSLIAYLLDIHKADPIKYGLVFPRFHNKLKQSYSDIDLDFSKSGRHKVIEYITQKYGNDNVAQISNLMEITPKVYVRDISRSCELGGSREEAVAIGNAVADSIPAEISTINSAIENAPLFSEYCKKYPQFIKYKALSNKYRSLGIHAAGIIIARRPLTGLVPVRTDKNGVTSLEYDKDVAEENGLVKMDILGLSTLDIIDKANEIIKSAGKQVPVVDYEIYDEATYNLISSGDTYGVFQFGTSGGTIELCKKIKPKTIEDLAVVTTLARPASKDIRDEFIKTRNGEREIILMHKSLGRALNPTFGFPLYDESLLVLAKDVAGWDLNDADKLRKLTKEKGKNPEKVKKWKQEFIQGAQNNGIHKEIVEKIWENIIEPYGRYSFNKSHAVLYSMISYHTAYLKAHFPVEFLLANLMAEIGSNAPDAEDNIAKIKKEIVKYKVKILPPDLNKSQLSYTLIEDNKLLTGLDALKFVSDEAINDIIEKRPFKDFTDFMARVDSRKVRANTIQALTSAGCLDNFGLNRKTIYLYCSDFRKKLQVWAKKHDHTKEKFEYPFPKEQEWSKQELYALEKEYLGESFTCKKKDAYGDFFHGEYVLFRDLKRIKSKTQVPSTKAEIVSIFTFKVKKEGSKFFGQEMAKVTMEDVRGDQMSVTVFPDRFTDINKIIKNVYKNKVKFDVGTVVHFSGSASVYEEEVNLILDRVYDMKPPPQMPEDLKARKISLKAKKETAVSSDLFTELEDELINEGLLDLDLGEDD
jgi:DNA polymerase III alpha subunit